MSKPEATWLRNKAEIAKACGLKYYVQPKKRLANLATVSGWLLHPEFPEKEQKGWLRSKVVAWHSRQVKKEGAGKIQNPKSKIQKPDTTAAPPAAKDELPFLESETQEQRMTRLLDLFEEKFFNPEKYPLDKITVWQVNFLKQHRPHLFTKETPEEPQTSDSRLQTSDSQAGDSPEHPVVKVPPRIGSQKDLAVFLQDYFRNRLKLTINPQTIDDWRGGQRLKPVFIEGKWTKPPKFPEKMGSGFWDTHECIEWVESWIVPVHSVGAGGTGELPGVAVDFDSAKQEHELWKMRREREIADGEYKSVKLFNGHLDRLGEMVNGSFNTMERELTRALHAALAGLGLAEASTRAMQDTATGAVRSSMDAMRALFVAECQAAAETETGEESEE